MLLKPAPMTRMAILGLRKYRQTVVSILHDLGTVQLEPLSKDVATMLRNEREGDSYRQVSDQLLRVRALKTVLPPLPVTDCRGFASTEELIQVAKSIDIDDKVASLERQKEKLLTELKEAENNIKLVEEFAFFPEDLRILQLSSARSYFGRLKSEKFSAFKKALDAYKQDVILDAKEGKEITHFVLVVLSNFPSTALATIVQTHDAHIEAVPKLSGKPPEIIQSQKNIYAKLSENLKHIDQQLAEISKTHFTTIACVEEQLEIENKKLEVIDNLGVSTDALALEGWVPKSKIEQLKTAFQNHTKGTIIYELDTDEKPPTLLTNPKKFKVFESFIRFYSLPSGTEFDPTLIFGLVFPVFYGLMLGDFGYGLVILLVCRWVIRRVEGGKRNFTIMPKPLRSFAMMILKPRQMVKLAKVMTLGAIMAMIFGFTFDLYFGFHLNGYLFNYLNTLGLNLPVHGAFLDPLEPHGLRKLLLISGYIGIGLVSFGLILGILNSYREGEKKHMIGKLGWLVFGWGIVLTGLALLNQQPINPLRHIEGVGYFGLILGGIGLMFYGEGARAIMELPSIISHILSYTRIVGILLASVILADVIDFIFLKALHHSLPIVIVGVMIFFIGHIFNIIIGVFEPGIQGARLIYVELFSKFFRGNGRPFNPFGTTRRFTSGQYDLEVSKNKTMTV